MVCPVHPVQLCARPVWVSHHRTKSVKSWGICWCRHRSISGHLSSCAWVSISRACLVLRRLVTLATVPHESVGQAVVGVCRVDRKPSCYLGQCGIWFRNTLVRLQKTSLGPSWSGLGLELISLIIPELALQMKPFVRCAFLPLTLKALQEPVSFAWVHGANLSCVCTQIISPPKTWNTSRQELQRNKLRYSLHSWVDDHPIDYFTLSKTFMQIFQCWPGELCCIPPPGLFFSNSVLFFFKSVLLVLIFLCNSFPCDVVPNVSL